MIQLMMPLILIMWVSFMIGIYQIRNKINNHRYIGRSVNITRRWRSHRNSLSGNYSGCIVLQNAWNKYGEDNFELVEL